MKNKGILISVLNQGEIRPELVDLLFRLKGQGKYRIGIEYPAKKPISYNRNDICKRFLETDYDYLLMIDSDCVPDEKLLELADYDKDIIGATCFGFIKNMIVPFAMKQRVDYKYDVIDADLHNGVVEVDAIGSGVMMIARRVLENLPYPFRNEYDPEGIKTKGLDFNFCRRAKLLGYKVFCNTDILASHWTTVDLRTMWLTFDSMLKMIKKQKEELEEMRKLTFEDYDNNIKGWMFPEQLKWLFNNAKRVNSIVEIGSYKGRSTHALLSGCEGTVWAVDPFKDFNNNEDYYPEFWKNVGGFKNLKVLKMKSEEATKQFEDKSIDMVFIDGGHTYEEVKQDIELWLPKTKKIICGHDYQGDDVKKAVDEKFKNINVHENIWFIKL